jgi:hypothetical protein
VIVAYEKDGQSLPEGYRLVLPELNGAAWIAYITSLSMFTSGANYPEVVSAAAPIISSVQSPQISNPITTPQPTKTPTPSQQPISSTIPSNDKLEVTTPKPVQRTSTPQITNSNFGVDVVLLYAFAAALAVISIATVALTIRHKIKRQ